LEAPHGLIEGFEIGRLQPLQLTLLPLMIAVAAYFYATEAEVTHQRIFDFALKPTVVPWVARMA